MPDPTVSETANADQQAASATAAEQQQLAPQSAEGGESATLEQAEVQPETTETTGAEPAGQPRVVKLEEHIQLRHRAQTAEEQAAALRAENEYLKQQAEISAQAQRQTFSKKPMLADYSDVDLFEKDLSVYADQEADIRASQKLVRQTYNQRYFDLAKKHPDFPEVGRKVPILPKEAQDAIMAHPHGPEIYYHLGLSGAEGYRIAAMPGATAAMEIGIIAARLSQIETTAPQKPKTVSSAPPPITPGNGSSVSLERDLADMPTADYAKARLEQLNKR